ncbi:hypothetical protein TNCV_2137341 [Trichonephila clavipes]|nr:hypothetical protein TNCV_2137341 [Trichonephila clavipes]
MLSSVVLEKENCHTEVSFTADSLASNLGPMLKVLTLPWNGSLENRVPFQMVSRSFTNIQKYEIHHPQPYGNFNPLPVKPELCSGTANEPILECPSRVRANEN